MVKLQCRDIHAPIHSINTRLGGFWASGKSVVKECGHIEKSSHKHSNRLLQHLNMFRLLGCL